MLKKRKTVIHHKNEDNPESILSSESGSYERTLGWTEELDEHMDPGIGIGMERTEVLDERTNGRNGNGERTGAGIG